MAEQFEHEVVHAKLKVSQGGDTRKIKEEVNLLVAHGWRLDDEKMGLQTSFTFPTFVKAVVSTSLYNKGINLLGIGIHE